MIILKSCWADVEKDPLLPLGAELLPGTSSLVHSSPCPWLCLFLFVYLAAPGLSCLVWDLQLWHAGSLVAACGIYFPDQGSNPDPCIGSTES